MHESGRTTALGRSPWAEAPAVALHSGGQLDVRRAVQRAGTDEPVFGKRNGTADSGPAEVLFGKFRLLPAQFLLLEGDNAVPIGSRAFDILLALLQKPNEIVSNQEIIEKVWPNRFVALPNLTVNISALRRALRDGRDGNRFIVNIPRRGYSFVASVEYRHKGAEHEVRVPQ